MSFLDWKFCAIGRDNDLHRLLFMPNGLPDGAKLAYYMKGQVFSWIYFFVAKLVSGFRSMPFSIFSDLVIILREYLVAISTEMV